MIFTIRLTISASDSISDKEGAGHLTGFFVDSGSYAYSSRDIMDSNLKLTINDLESYRQTVDECRRIAREHRDDILPYLSEETDLFAWYERIRSLPYVADPQGIETISRPRYTLKEDWNGPRDCDDKTVLILSYCHLKEIPCRIIVCGQTPAPHHIYPEVKLNVWMPADATYPHRSVFGRRLYTEVFREVFDA